MAFQVNLLGKLEESCSARAQCKLHMFHIVDEGAFGEAVHDFLDYIWTGYYRGRSLQEPLTDVEKGDIGEILIYMVFRHWYDGRFSHVDAKNVPKPDRRVSRSGADILAFIFADEPDADEMHVCEVKAAFQGQSIQGHLSEIRSDYRRHIDGYEQSKHKLGDELAYIKFTLQEAGKSGWSLRVTRFQVEYYEKSTCVHVYGAIAYHASLNPPIRVEVVHIDRHAELLMDDGWDPESVHVFLLPVVDFDAKARRWLSGTR